MVGIAFENFLVQNAVQKSLFRFGYFKGTQNCLGYLICQIAISSTCFQVLGAGAALRMALRMVPRQPTALGSPCLKELNDLCGIVLDSPHTVQPRSSATYMVDTLEQRRLVQHHRPHQGQAPQALLYRQPLASLSSSAHGLGNSMT